MVVHALGAGRCHRLQLTSRYGHACQGKVPVASLSWHHAGLHGQPSMSMLHMRQPALINMLLSAKSFASLFLLLSQRDAIFTHCSPQAIRHQPSRPVLRIRQLSKSAVRGTLRLYI